MSPAEEYQLALRQERHEQQADERRAAEEERDGEGKT